MKTKLDEDPSETLTAVLEQAGHVAATVLGQSWGGFKDPVLWPMIVAEGIFFITGDKGFGDIRAYPPGTHAGILLLRPDQESIPHFRALLTAVLEKHRLDDLARAVTVATPRSIRIRRPAAS